MTNIKTGEIWVAAICVKYGTLISNLNSQIMRSLVDFFEVAIAFGEVKEKVAITFYNSRRWRSHFIREVNRSNRQ